MKKSGSNDDDRRFAAARSDPRFKKQKKKNTKVKIDARFAAALTDDNFGVAQAPVDKYGRPTSGQDRKSELAHFYEIDDGEEQSKKRKSADEIRLEELQALSRGEEAESSSSSSDDEDNEEEIKLDMIAWDSDLPQTHQIVSDMSSSRIALTDCDWTHLSAKDVLAIIQSLCPLGGRCLRVDVYISEFGAKALAEEARFGPSDLFVESITQQQDTYEHIEEVESGFDPDKLRKYELSKLRRYYAIATLDSPETAETVYRNDGIELESTSMPLSLAMVEPSQQFDQAKLRDSATFHQKNSTNENDLLKDYEPPEKFTVKARQHTKIECTWDEDDPGRKISLAAAFSKDKEKEDLDLKAYLASDSDSEDEEKKRRLRAQLGLPVDNEDSDSDDDQVSNNYLDLSSSATLLEDPDLALNLYQQDKKKQQKRADRHKKQSEQPADAFFIAQVEDDDDDRDYDATKLLKAQRLSKKKKLKGKRKRQLDAILAETTKSDFRFNPTDNRFANALENDHRFAVDPANPEFKETAVMASVLEHQSKSRRARREYNHHQE